MMVASLSGVSLTIKNTGSLNVQHNSPAVISTASAIAIAPMGRLDLSDNALYISYAGQNDPIAAIRSYITSGYNHGAWNGPGIITSNADATHALGFGDSADGALAGAPANTVEIKWTRIGDVNLDGTVNFSDVLALIQHYGSGQGNANWDQGDMNYDGSVTFPDVLALVQNYGHSLSAVATGPNSAGASIVEAVISLEFLRKRRPLIQR